VFEWQEIGLANSNEVGNISYDGTYLDSEEELESTDDISIEVINNEEDSNYISPSGVSGEYNEYEGRFTKEQALSINFSEDGIPEDTSYFISKITGNSTMDSDKRNSFFTYKNLEMFIQGNSTQEGSTFSSNDDVEYCVRLGRENNYYEIRQSFFSNNPQDWDEFRLNLEALSRYKYDNRESYDDFGIDGCLDEYETGNQTCLSDITNKEICLNEDGDYDDLLNNQCGSLSLENCLNVNGCDVIDDICSPIIDITICDGSNVQSDPNEDNYVEETGIGTQGNDQHDDGEEIFYDENEMGVYDGISIPSYNSDDDYLYWIDDENINLDTVCHNCKELRIKGEPSISRIDYIMFGVINNSADRRFSFNT
jgi:hypothetical protein